MTRFCVDRFGVFAAFGGEIANGDGPHLLESRGAESSFSAPSQVKVARHQQGPHGVTLELGTA